MSAESPDCSSKRIHALHEWYVNNVMPFKLTHEVERLWFDWCKAGYNGNDLLRVIRYLRQQISAGKRQNGALSLSNLLGIDLNGIPRFATDLGMASAIYQVDRQFSKLPTSEATGAPRRSTRPGSNQPTLPGVHLTPEELEDRRARLAQLKAELGGELRSVAASEVDSEPRRQLPPLVRVPKY